jgi:hypothetical protein
MRRPLVRPPPWIDRHRGEPGACALFLRNTPPAGTRRVARIIVVRRASGCPIAIRPDHPDVAVRDDVQAQVVPQTTRLKDTRKADKRKEDSIAFCASQAKSPLCTMEDPDRIGFIRRPPARWRLPRPGRPGAGSRGSGDTAASSRRLSAQLAGRGWPALPPTTGRRVPGDSHQPVGRCPCHSGTVTTCMADPPIGAMKSAQCAAAHSAPAGSTRGARLRCDG